MTKVFAGVLGLLLLVTGYAQVSFNVASNQQDEILKVTPVLAPVLSANKSGAGCTQMGKVATLGGIRALECRKVAGNKLAWSPITAKPSTPVQRFLAEDISKCQIKDFVNYTPGEWTGGDLGYPAYGEMPALGPVNIAIIPVDFSDNPGGAAPNFLIGQMKTADRWIKQYSHGKMQYIWDFKSKWVRAPKVTKYYNLSKTSIGPDGSFITNGKDPQTKEQAVSQLFEAAEKTYDLSKAEYVYFVFPKNIGKKIESGFDGRNENVKTKKMSYQLGFGTSAGYAYTFGELWHQWLHETLHSHGLIGHAPGNEYPYNIMAFDGGPGKSLTAWDTFILKWFDDNQVACFDRETLESESVTLTSMDVNAPGVKTAMVRLSEHEMIVIESRRKSTFTKGFPSGFYGVQAYYLTTKHDGQRYDWALGRAAEKKYFAYFLEVDAMNHGLGQPSVGRLSNLNVVAYLGDAFSYKDLKIKFTKSGDFVLLGQQLEQCLVILKVTVALNIIILPKFTFFGGLHRFQFSHLCPKCAQLNDGLFVIRGAFS